MDSKKFHFRSLLIYPSLIFVCALLMLPLVVTFTNAFMSESEIGLTYTTTLSIFDRLDRQTEKFVQLKLIPSWVTFTQYATVLLYQPSFLILLSNSLKITIPVVFGNAFVSLLGAYGFTIWRWRYKEALFFIYIVVMLMPLQAVLVPNYIIADRLRLMHTYWAIILPGIFAPFGVFLLRQSMKSIPDAYYEAARIDGASDYYIFLHIIIPQMKSGIAALVMLVFIEYWNLVEQSVIFIKDYYKEPLSVFLSRMADGRIGLIFAASCVYMFIPFWFLVLGQQDLEKGIELSGVK